MNTDTIFMKKAIELAMKAGELREVPVGALIVCDGQIISAAFNRREIDKNSVAHAEILAIDEACKALGGWRLSECTLYVTLEPCPMCAGAIINSRIKRVVYGARDPKAGAFGSVLNMNSYPLNHRCELEIGVLEDECSRVLSDFFRNLRK